MDTNIRHANFVTVLCIVFYSLNGLCHKTFSSSLIAYYDSNSSKAVEIVDDDDLFT